MKEFWNKVRQNLKSGRPQLNFMQKTRQPSFSGRPRFELIRRPPLLEADGGAVLYG